MNWHSGLRRLRMVATVALIIGVALCASTFLTRSLGYAPDASIASLFNALWPAGLAMAILGGLLWVAIWVLQGFVPLASAAKGPPTGRPHFDE